MTLHHSIKSQIISVLSFDSTRFTALQYYGRFFLVSSYCFVRKIKEQREYMSGKQLEDLIGKLRVLKIEEASVLAQIKELNRTRVVVELQPQ